jgi:hypothetical protein
MTDGSDWRMEMSAQSEHELDAVNASIESTLQRLYHLRRRRNFLASPLLRLPTELILKIFVHAIELDDDDSSSIHLHRTTAAQRSWSSLQSATNSAKLE